jgi:hypothetical protein
MFLGSSINAAELELEKRTCAHTLRARFGRREQAGWAMKFRLKASIVLGIGLILYAVVRMLFG